MQDIAIIFNPKARSQKTQGLEERLREIAPEAALRMTQGPGDAERLAAEAAREGFRVVAAAGGDGTVNHVANGIAGTAAVLGVLPFGTMNVFAKEHGIPGTLEKAWAVLRGNAVKEIDLLAANDTHFIQLAGAGFDAQVVKETSWQSKMNLGPLSYLITAARVANRRPPRIFVEAGGRTSEGCAVIVGNGRYYGAKLILFPKARTDDGLLDVLIFKSLRYLDIARYSAGVLLGTHTGMSGVEYFQVAEARVHGEGGIPAEVDGELCGTLPVTYRVAGKMKLAVPRNSTFTNAGSYLPSPDSR